VHQVEDYESGLYILIRNFADKEDLQKEMDAKFRWSHTEFEHLYLLQTRDLCATSKAISCSQDIASDGAFSLGMLCNFIDQLEKYGAHRYKELYWECGAIGQQLYLEATSMGLSGTGIGCFLDDDMHGLLGLKNNRYQILYHFTVGRGYVDSRITTRPAYN
jgi:nitroreductase